MEKDGDLFDTFDELESPDTDNEEEKIWINVENRREED